MAPLPPPPPASLSRPRAPPSSQATSSDHLSRIPFTSYQLCIQSFNLISPDCQHAFPTLRRRRAEADTEPPAEGSASVIDWAGIIISPAGISEGGGEIPFGLGLWRFLFLFVFICICLFGDQEAPSCTEAEADSPAVTISSRESRYGFYRKFITCGKLQPDAAFRKCSSVSV